MKLQKRGISRKIPLSLLKNILLNFTVRIFPALSTNVLLV